MYKISIKLGIVYKNILENNFARAINENLPVYEYLNFILCLKVWNGVINYKQKLQTETDILIIRWCGLKYLSSNGNTYIFYIFLFSVWAASSFQPVQQPEHCHQYIGLLITSLKNLEIYILSRPLLWHIKLLTEL